MSDFIDIYVSHTWRRDRVMAIVQFLPMALADTANCVGGPALKKSLENLSTMSDRYRAITRLSLLFHALSKRTLAALACPQGDAVLHRADQLTHFFHVFYCIFENTAVLTGHGVLSETLARLGGCAVTCWFYTLLITILRSLYVLTTNAKLSIAQRKREYLSLLKHGCFFVFSLTCMPKGGPQLLEQSSGPLAPLHQALRLIAPKHIELNNTIRGSLGFVASMCDFVSI